MKNRRLTDFRISNDFVVFFRAFIFCKDEFKDEGVEGGRGSERYGRISTLDRKPCLRDSTFHEKKSVAKLKNGEIDSELLKTEFF